ncbi:molecular chaperone DjiA [Roseicitreum antarcticum]|uniref:DnaJ like chaperone protein n=1 Tax=Roseicitreum antarcticum TaxID=564137 RepID=A0A1H2VVN3_9RHOB|nr:molecular chaperone DjiA [Roseicitreum antarcticum]SDW72281.1 DnaJ like chaperone protein [Roseicitreum antarcticum]
MSIWTRISAALSALAKGESLSTLFDRLRTPPERSVAFTIAVIALGAKMAKADGHVSRNEVAAFRSVFIIPPSEEASAARIFNLARQDIAGFDAYARKIAAMFRPGDPVLVDLMEGLLHIAVADGAYHAQEDAFLSEVARIFGLSPRSFACLRARYVPDSPPDPYVVLEVTPETPLDQIRAKYKTAVRETHPDRMAARGVPPEAIKLASERLVSLNRAWEEISAARAA